MTLECELKYLDVDLEALARRLRGVGAVSSGRYFESNTVFDRPDRSLKQAGILLRLRERRDRGVLTVKRPPDGAPSSMLKVFEEIETTVGDVATMRTALETIGFERAFTYEKVREQWRFMECVVCLDHLPFGDYAEIEGTDASVPACAAFLGLDAHGSTTATYYALNLEHLRTHGLDPDENFVFAEAIRASLLEELGKE